MLMDVHTAEWRSYNMSRIHGTNTKPEMLVRRYLHAAGLRYRLHGRSPAGMAPGKPTKKGKYYLPGKPDIVLAKYKTVVFIHGCFWHGHENCKYYRPPTSRADFWQKKIARNQARDQQAIAQLEAAGWRVFTVWECDLKPALAADTLEILYCRINPQTLSGL